MVEIRLVKSAVNGLYTDADSPLLVNDAPITEENSQIEKAVRVVHQVEEGRLELMDTADTISDEEVVSAFVTDSFSNWLLFLDEDLTDITVYKGDSITLRPYGEWYWKKDGEPAEVQALKWTFPSNEYYVTEGWQNNVPTDYSGSTENYYGITKAQTKDYKYTINGYAKYDRELNEPYWYYHASDLQPGDFTLYVSNGSGGTRTIQVHVINESSHENDKPGTVAGVDNIVVNLFDYDKGGILDVGPRWVDGHYDWNDKDHNLANNTNFDNTTINAGHDLKFLSSGSGLKAENYKHGYNGYYSENVHPGIVKDDLTTEGYPELKYGSDLKYLFDTSKTSWVDGDKMIAYPNVKGLFRQDARGYYYFNSNINYAYYDGTNNKFKLYEHTYTQSTSGTGRENGKPIGFFPFHDYESTGNLNVNQNNNLNHHLGMSMKLQFNIPEGKQVNGEDIVFDFSGDDDLWVYIDGKLVLDMGGIHQPVPGSINFTTGKVKVYGQQDKTIEFTPGYHTMEVFYLERGGCDSNCSIMFNMPLVLGRGTFKVVKKGEKSENKALQGAVFGLWETEDCSGDPVRQATSANNGEVVFNDLSVKNAGQVYYMKEITAPNGYVRSNIKYTVTASNAPGPDGKYTFTIRELENPDHALDTIGQEPYTPVIYNLKQVPRNITLQKKWQNEYGEEISAPSGVTATFVLHKKGFYQAANTQPRILYTVILQNTSEGTLAQGYFYEGDRIQLNYEFKNSPISTTLTKNGSYYADLGKSSGENGPRHVTYTVAANDANNDHEIIFRRENDSNGKSHGFETVEWELVEAAPAPGVPTEQMEDRTVTFTLPNNGNWQETFSNLDTYDVEGYPFMYWIEETGTTAQGYFPVTVNGADLPLAVGETTQTITNMKKTSVKIIKAVKGTQTPIPGAGFTLTQVDETGSPVLDGITKEEAFTGAEGIVIFDNLEPGRYKLVETTVPGGFIRNEGPYYIIVNDDYTTTLDTSVPTTLIAKEETASVFTVENEPGAALPNTGGRGTTLHYALGTLLTLCALALLIAKRRRAD